MENSNSPIAMPTINIKSECTTPGPSSTPPPDVTPPPAVIDEDEIGKIWTFLAENVMENDKKLVEKRCGLNESVWEVYIKRHESKKSAGELQELFHQHEKLLPLIGLEKAVKVKMYFFYKLPVESVFLDVLKLEADIEIDENGCIVKYKEKKEGGFALDAKGVPDEVPETSFQKSVNTTLGNSDAEHCKAMCSKLSSSARRLKFTEEEDLDMWNFLLKQISIPKTGNAEKNRIFSKGITIWEEYKKQTSTPRGVSALNTRFRRMMAPKLHEANLPKESKLKLYYELRIPVDCDYLERLREAAEVRVDNEGCITMYRKNSPEDGKKRRLGRGNEEEKETDDGKESDASGRSEPIHKQRRTDNQIITRHHSEPITRSQFKPMKCVRITEDPKIVGLVERILSGNNSTEARSVSQSSTDSDESTIGKTAAFSETAESAKSRIDEQMMNSLVEYVSENREVFLKNQLTEKATSAAPSFNHRKTKDFLANVRNFIVNQDSPQLGDILKKVDAMIQKASDQDELPMDRIRVILEATLAMIPI